MLTDRQLRRLVAVMIVVLLAFVAIFPETMPALLTTITFVILLVGIAVVSRWLQP